jgi:ribosomal protein S27AE
MDGIATTLFDAVCPDCGGGAFLTEHGDRWETADLWFAPAGIQCSFGTFGLCAVRPMLVRCLGCGREGVDADLDRGAERTVPDGLERCAICGELRGSADGPLSTVLCRCSNVACRRCGRRELRRPVADYYNVETGRIIHVPWFGGVRPCLECSQTPPPPPEPPSMVGWDS